MIDPDDPQQAKKYTVSGYIFIAAMIFLSISIPILLIYAYIKTSH